jgi:carboxymethylenebutenolidase
MTRILHAAALITVASTAVAVAGVAAPAAAQSVPPADDASARVRLEESSRHGEYVDIPVRDRATPVRAFVVYPEIATKAAIVVVWHDSYELTDWVRGVADQLAADGFIAIAPDLAAGKAPSGGEAATSASGGDALNVSDVLPSPEHNPALYAVHAYGAKLPASTGKTLTLVLRGTPKRLDDDWARTIANLRHHTK